MTAMVQTDLGPPAATKYKEESVDDPVSAIVSLLSCILRRCEAARAPLSLPDSMKYNHR